MSTSDRGTGIVGYKVRKSADTKHHLIVVRDATNVGHDRMQLATMAKQAQAADDPRSASSVGKIRNQFKLSIVNRGIARDDDPVAADPPTDRSEQRAERFGARDQLVLMKDQSSLP